MELYTFLINIETPFIRGNLAITEDTPMKAYKKYKEQLEEANGKLGTKVMPYPSFIECKLDTKKGTSVFLINPK